MTRETVMSTPIFDQLLREMAQRAEPGDTPQDQPSGADKDWQPARPPRRRHRAD